MGCAADQCRQGREPCPCPEVCGLTRERMYQPDYGVEGPHRARAGLTVPEYLAGAFALVVIFLALAHYFGFF